MDESADLDQMVQDKETKLRKFSLALESERHARWLEVGEVKETYNDLLKEHNDLQEQQKISRREIFELHERVTEIPILQEQLQIANSKVERLEAKLARKQVEEEKLGELEKENEEFLSELKELQSELKTVKFAADEANIKSSELETNLRQRIFELENELVEANLKHKPHGPDSTKSPERNSISEMLSSSLIADASKISDSPMPPEPPIGESMDIIRDRKILDLAEELRECKLELEKTRLEYRSGTPTNTTENRPTVDGTALTTEAFHLIKNKLCQMEMLWNQKQREVEEKCVKLTRKTEHVGEVMADRLEEMARSRLIQTSLVNQERFQWRQTLSDAVRQREIDVSRMQEECDRRLDEMEEERCGALVELEGEVSRLRGQLTVSLDKMSKLTKALIDSENTIEQLAQQLDQKLDAKPEPNNELTVQTNHIVRDTNEVASQTEVQNPEILLADQIPAELADENSIEEPPPQINQTKKPLEQIAEIDQEVLEEKDNENNTENTKKLPKNIRTLLEMILEHDKTLNKKNSSKSAQQPQLSFIATENGKIPSARSNEVIDLSKLETDQKMLESNNPRFIENNGWHNEGYDSEISGSISSSLILPDSPNEQRCGSGRSASVASTFSYSMSSTASSCAVTSNKSHHSSTSSSSFNSQSSSSSTHTIEAQSQYDEAKSTARFSTTKQLNSYQVENDSCKSEKDVMQIQNSLDWNRLWEIMRRNVQQPRHLRSTYPSETQNYETEKLVRIFAKHTNLIPSDPQFKQSIENLKSLGKSDGLKINKIFSRASKSHRKTRSKIEEPLLFLPPGSPCASSPNKLSPIAGRKSNRVVNKNTTNQDKRKGRITHRPLDYLKPEDVLRDAGNQFGFVQIFENQ